MSELNEMWRINGQPVGQCAESSLLSSYNRIHIDNARYRRRIAEAMYSELRLSQRNGEMRAEVRRWKLIAAVGVSTAAVLGSVLMLVLWGG